MNSNSNGLFTTKKDLVGWECCGDVHGSPPTRFQMTRLVRFFRYNVLVDGVERGCRSCTTINPHGLTWSDLICFLPYDYSWHHHEGAILRKGSNCHACSWTDVRLFCCAKRRNKKKGLGTGRDSESPKAKSVKSRPEMCDVITFSFHHSFLFTVQGQGG